MVLLFLMLCISWMLHFGLMVCIRNKRLLCVDFIKYWSLLKVHVVLSFLFIFCLLVAVYSSCLQDCGTVRFILLHPTIFA